MKKLLLTLTIILLSMMAYSQATYYWVGGLAGTTGINTSANWNTAIDGTGATRPASVNAADVLIIDGTNLGGATPATGPATILASGSVTVAQFKVVNGARINFPRPTSGTSTITIAGNPGEDFVVESGCELNVLSSSGSIRFTFQTTVDAARVSGKMSVITGQQFRFDNTITGAAGMFRFTSGSSFTTNITSTSTSYAFGSSTQSSPKWVIFEDGSDLYYEGGYSANGSNSTYQPIDFKPNSNYHHRANNGGGSFTNKKDFGNIIVENSSTLTFDGPTYIVNNLTVTAGATAIGNLTGILGIQGNLIVNGTFNADPTSTNQINFSGSAPQTVSGTGSINIPGIVVAESASVTLARDITTFGNADIFGILNFATFKVLNAINFKAQGISAAQTGTADRIIGDNKVTNIGGAFIGITGQTITGPGIPLNTVVVGSSTSDNAIYLSKVLTSTGSAGAISVESAGATLQTANTNGFNPTSGSVGNATTTTFENNISYIFDAANTFPFGVNTGTTPISLTLKNITVNAPITVNAGVNLLSTLTLNNKVTLRPADTLHILPTANLVGTFSATNYIATDYVTTTGVQSFVKYDAVSALKVVPVGTALRYLPVTLTPTTSSDFLIAVFTGITNNGQVNGTQLLGSQKQLVVDAVWNIARPVGTGNVTVSLNWPQALEGTTFATLPGTDVGLIKNTGTTYAVPVGVGDNTANTVTGMDATGIGSFAAGAIPQTDPFIFNAFPIKTYGQADFGSGIISANTTEPIILMSSNTSVATIIGNNIHIVSAGTSIITATQASDGFYPAANKSQTVIVNKAALTIKADKKTKFELVPNPALTITYTGFVLGETATVLAPAPTITTTAVTSSAPGFYPITVSGAMSPNYNISFINDTMFVLAKQAQTLTFPAILPKVYGNAAFTVTATTTNATIPIVYMSSNTSVATIAGNLVTITGAGTTTITASQAGSDGFFAATPKTQVLTVTKKALTITAIDTVKTYLTANPAFTTIASGFVNGDNLASLLTPLDISTAATTSSLPGVYNIMLSGATSNNYTVTLVNGKLSILPSSGTSQQYINAYGNTAGNISLVIYSPQTSLADVIVYNSLGQPVAKKNILINRGFTTSVIPTPTISSGIYIVKVYGPGVDLGATIRVIR